MAIPAKVARNAGGGFFAWNFRIEKDEDRGPGATQGDAEEVSFVIREAARERVPVVPRGGATTALGQLFGSYKAIIARIGGMLVILFGLALSSLLEIKRIRVGNFLPALAIAPLIVWVLVRLGVM